MASTPRDENHVPGLIAKSDADSTPVIVEADPVTKRLKVNTTITGTTIPVAGASTGVPVAIVDGSGNQITSFGGGTQYANGAVQATPTGTVALGWDGANVRAAATDTGGKLNVNASLAAETTKVIGVTRTADGSGNLITSTGNALDINIKSGNPTSITANAGTNLNTSALALDATLTGGTQQSKITDGTNVANILKSDGTVAGENSQLVAPAVRTIAFTTSSSGVQTILANTDVSHYAWIEVVYTSVGSGLALTGQFSTASGGTYVNQSTFASNTGSPNGALGTTVNTVYTSPIRGNFFQIAVSALTSGTFTGTVTLRATPQPFITALASSSQSGTWTVGSNSATGSALPANAFFIGLNSGGGGATLVGAISLDDNSNGVASSSFSNKLATVGHNYLYFNSNSTWERIRQIENATNSTGTGIAAAGLVAQLDDTSPTTITENQFGNLRIDTARQLRVNNQQSPDATLLTTYSAQISTNTTTTPTAATAYISNIVISVTTAGTTSTVNIKDKQGTPLTIVNALSTAALSAGDNIFNFQTPIKMVSGIDIVTAGAAAATFSIFINYYQ